MKTHVHIQETDENEEKTLQKTLNTTNTRKHNIRRLKLLEWEKKKTRREEWLKTEYYKKKESEASKKQKRKMKKKTREWRWKQTQANTQP